MKFIKNYKSTLILLVSIIVGSIIGIIFKEDAIVLKPFGEIFLNMLLVIIVPLIFLSISTSIYKMKTPKRMGKILITTFMMFLVTSVIALLIGIVSTYSFDLISSSSVESIREELDVSDNVNTTDELNLLERTVSMLTVDDFSKLLSRDNMIALIVMSLLIGISMHMSGSKSESLFKVMESILEVINKFIKIIMYYAPIGIGCYMASLVSSFGASMAYSYVYLFIIYLIVSLFVYFVVYSIYAYISGGANAVKIYWKNVLPSTVTALATCSSAASMPVNIECTKKMGVSADVVDTTISLGTNFHKDGSVIGSVFKIMFLVYLFNDIGNISIFKIMGIALIATLLVTAVPIGGGTISEMLIITMLGYPVFTLPILTIIATIIDAPATVLNVVGDSSCALLINKIVDEKD